jgi:hypothetical protein
LFFGFIDEIYLKEKEKEEGFLEQLIVELTSLVLPSKELMRFFFFVATWSAANLTPLLYRSLELRLEAFKTLLFVVRRRLNPETSSTPFFPSLTCSVMEAISFEN